MSVGEHIETLRAKHASLEEAIDQENLRPHPDDMRIQELKKEKLRIKDEIAGLSDGLEISEKVLMAPVDAIEGANGYRRALGGADALQLLLNGHLGLLQCLFCLRNS